MSAAELVDVVDANDNIVSTATRNECHRNPLLIHRCTHFTLYNQAQDALLLTKRPLDKEGDAGKYMFAGEHVLAGESYEQALIRGTEEEFGFTPKSWSFVGKHRFRYDLQTEMAQMYLVTWTGEQLIWNNSDFELVTWVPKDSKILQSFTLGKITKFWVNKICL